VPKSRLCEQCGERQEAKATDQKTEEHREQLKAAHKPARALFLPKQLSGALVARLEGCRKLLLTQILQGRAKRKARVTQYQCQQKADQTRQ
jgi:hypothetical protein